MKKLLKINNVNQKITSLEKAADNVTESTSDSDGGKTETGMTQEEKIAEFDKLGDFTK